MRGIFDFDAFGFGAVRRGDGGDLDAFALHFDGFGDFAEFRGNDGVFIITIRDFDFAFTVADFHGCGVVAETGFVNCDIFRAGAEQRG